MNKQDRAAVIRAICKELQVQMLEQNERIPESWDGVELRQLLADTAAKGPPWLRWTTSERAGVGLTKMRRLGIGWVEG